MNQNLTFSGEAYEIENGSVKVGERSQDPNYIILDTVDTNKDTIGNETSAKKNSMQAMVVGEIKDKYKDKEDADLKNVPGYPESVITKDITIAYAGTNGWQDIKTDVREIGANDKHDNGAFQSALKYANEIEKKYSVKNGFTIATTGHSLGGAEAIYVSVLKGYNAFTYGAAGAGLSDEQIKNYSGLIVNLYDTSDTVTSGLLTGGKNKIPFYSFGVDNAGWKTFGHSRDQFKLDNTGNYIDKYGDIAVYSDGHGGIAVEQTLLAQQILENKNKIRVLEMYDPNSSLSLSEIKRLKAENKWLQEQIKQFSTLNNLRVTLMASGGGLSSNEQIYLEDSQALAIVKLASSKFDSAMENSIAIYKKSITELQDLWEEGKSLVHQHTPDLSYSETMEAMEMIGCTKRAMVDEPAYFFQDKISKANRIKAEFAKLTQQINAKINELVQRDQDLAQQLKGALT